MRLKFWGVRGSLPAPLNYDGLTGKLFQAVAGAKGVDLGNPDAIRSYLASLPFYVGGVIGGNTTCVEVLSGPHTIIVDAGSGLRPLGLSLLAREFARGQGTLHLFFTHAHWDHPEAIFWNGQIKISKVALVLTRGSNAVWLGPAAYRSPEQLQGRLPDARSDLYALGLILYQLLAGVHPYESESGEVAAVKQLQSDPYRLSALNPTVPPGLEAVVLKLLARDPTARFASAGEAYGALLAEAGT